MLRRRGRNQTLLSLNHPPSDSQLSLEPADASLQPRQLGWRELRLKSGDARVFVVDLPSGQSVAFEGRFPTGFIARAARGCLHQRG
jgi:hypothetical protein